MADLNYVDLGFGGIAVVPDVSGWVSHPNSDIYFALNFERYFRSTTATETAYNYNAHPITAGYPDGIVTVTFFVTARKTDGTDGAVWEKRAAFLGVSSGTLTQISTTKDVCDPIKTAGASTWDVAITAASDTVRVGFTGQAATTIDWHFWVNRVIVFNCT